MRHRASIDFVVYNRVSNRPVLAIEVDGFAFHENNPVQLARGRPQERDTRRARATVAAAADHRQR